MSHVLATGDKAKLSPVLQLRHNSRRLNVHNNTQGSGSKGLALNPSAVEQRHKRGEENKTRSEAKTANSQDFQDSKLLP